MRFRLVPKSMNGHNLTIAEVLRSPPENFE